MERGGVYNIIVTPELWSKVNARNRGLVKEFLAYCASSDKSPQTIKQYESQLRVFFIWNLKENYNKNFIDIRKIDFINFFGYGRQELGWSSGRVASLRAVLSTFSNYIERFRDEDFPTFRNVVKILEPVTVQPVREKTVVDSITIEAIIKTLVADGLVQEGCWVALLYSSGMRKAEALQMKDSFFCEENLLCDVLYRTPKIRTKGRGVQGKRVSRYVFKETFLPYLELWRKEREKLGITNKDLFVVKRNGEYVPATISTVNSWSHRITVRTGIDFYPHMMRHLWTTNLKKAGYPDTVIQKLQQWASQDMIKIYNDADDEDEIVHFFEKNKSK